MHHLKALLRTAADRTTFELGSRQISSGQFRELLESHSQKDREFRDASNARVVLPDDLLSSLIDYIRADLAEYIEPSTDQIGHAFPIGGAGLPEGESVESFHTVQEDGIAIDAETSPVGTFARALARGAVVIGAGRVTSLVMGWMRGEPVAYQTRSVLNVDGLLVEPVSGAAGVRIESLPLSTDRLTGYLPLHQGQSLNDYLGRMVMTVDHSAAPALFRPGDKESVRGTRATAVPGAGEDVVCQALALETDAFVEVAMSWNDFGDLDAFHRRSGERTWSRGGAHFRGALGAGSSLRTDFRTGVTTLTFRHPTEWRVDGERFAANLAALAEPGFNFLSIAAARWLRSKDGASLEDRFIDLRVALESLYLHDLDRDRSQEMAFRLALFGAWHLGANLQERKEIRKTLRDAYATASRAVHSGNIDTLRKKRRGSDHGRSENLSLLSDAQDIARQGLLTMLRDGPPRDWWDLILGGEGNATE